MKKYATHLYTYTWVDEEIKVKRKREILSDKKNTFFIKEKKQG